MESSLSDLTQIAVVILVAVALGLLLVRFRQPPIVGYILTGIVLGPTALGFVDQTGPIHLLAEIGVLLLLFLIGMELSLRAFMLVLRPALLTAGLQLLAGIIITFAFGYFAGWTVQASILLGFAVSVSSTALVVKMLEDIGELRTDCGRITVGVLIAQDIAIVPILLLSKSLGGAQAMDFTLFAKLALAIGALFALIWALGRPGKVTIPFSDRIVGKPDLLTLAMLAICLAGAATSGLFGLSPVYGAFVAGLVVGQSNLRSEAIPATQPVQSLLIVVFFLSIGLLIDLKFIAENWVPLLAFVAGIIIIKSALNVAILRFVGEPWETAFPAGIIMSQIGEFSFVIAAVGLSANVIDYAAYQAAIAVIAVSLLISPFWLITVRRFHDVAQRGIANFRVALAEVYEDELAELEKGAAGVRRAGRSARRWARAAKRAAITKGEALVSLGKDTNADASEESAAVEGKAPEHPTRAGPAANAVDPAAGERTAAPETERVVHSKPAETKPAETKPAEGAPVPGQAGLEDGPESRTRPREEDSAARDAPAAPGSLANGSGRGERRET